MENKSHKPISIRRNSVANYIGAACQALLGFLFIPLYIKYLGIESYGLIGFATSLNAVLSLTDFGLSSTLRREFALCSDFPESALRMRNLLRTLQTILWGFSAFIGLAMIGIAPLISKHWINAGSLGVETVQRAVVLMGLTAALQGPLSLYSGGIFGLQRHVLGNCINVLLTILRSGGVILVLAFLSPTINAFFICQFCVAFIGALSVGIILWNLLPRTHSVSCFQISQLKNVWRFASGMGISSTLWFIVRQIDKLILIKILPLKLFGYYALASAVASAATFCICEPLFATFLPRYTQLYAAGADERLKATYRFSCRLNSMILIPTVVLLSLFSREVLLVWTRNPVIAEEAHLFLSLLVIGYGLNHVAYLPYAMQIACSRVRLGVYTNSFAILFIVPALTIATRFYGGIGAAAVWIILNCFYLLSYVNIFHRSFLKGETRQWYAGILLPLMLSIGFGLSGRLLFPNISGFIMVLYIAGLWAIIVAVTAIATPSMRKMILAPSSPLSIEPSHK